MINEHFLETDETAGKETEVTEETTEETTSVEDVEEKSPEIWESHGFPDKESFEKVFVSNRSMVGKQSNTIGEDRATIRNLTKELDDLKGKMVAPPPEYDPDDPESLVRVIDHNVKSTLAEQTATQKAEATQEQQLQAKQNEYNEAIQSDLVEFQKVNPGITPENLMEVARYADKLGLSPTQDGPNILQAAFDAMVSKGRRSLPSKKEIKDASDKIKDLPKKAEGVRSTVKSEINYNDWDNLTDKERESSLMDAPMGN